MNLYILDGSHLAWRAYFALPNLTLNGNPVGAIYGVVKILSNFVKEFQPGKVIAAFDISKSEYRKKLYPDYKAKRDDSEDGKLHLERYMAQIDIIRELIECFGMTTISQRGIEADDIASYLVSRFKEGAFPTIGKCLLITADKDWAALVDEKVLWFDPINHDLITHRNFVESFGVKIEQFPDYKALIGDKSDNIPHPKGIGPASAVNLLKEYGSLEHMLDIKHSKIEPHREVVTLARKLVALNLHEIDNENSAWNQIEQKAKQQTSMAPNLVDTLQALEFNSVLESWEELAPKWEAFSACSLLPEPPPSTLQT